MRTIDLCPSCNAPTIPRTEVEVDPHGTGPLITGTRRVVSFHCSRCAWFETDFQCATDLQ